MKEWYYSFNGRQVGPLHDEQIIKLIENGTIKPETNVWNNYEDLWKNAIETELSSYFQNNQLPPPPDSLQNPNYLPPPPLPGTDVDNTFVWLVVIVPVLGGIIEFAVGQSLIWVYWILNTILLSFDQMKLKNAGYKAPNFWLIIIIPVYLWRRSTILRQKRSYFWTWIFIFIFSIILAALLSRESIEEQSCTIVTNILYEHLNSSDVKCKKVEITNEISDSLAEGRVTLTNGNTLRILIKKNDGKVIYVNIPNRQ
jgi:hypothetical protein